MGLRSRIFIEVLLTGGRQTRQSTGSWLKLAEGARIFSVVNTLFVELAE